jgi:hypothetical protein
MERVQEHAPHIEPDPSLFPGHQSSPAGAWRGVSLRKRLPASAIAEDPEDAFNHGSIGYRLGTTVGRGFGLRQKLGEKFPLLVG